MSFNSDPSSLVNQVPESVEYPDDPKELQQFQTFLYRRLSSALNTKEGSLYQPVETGNFQRYFTPDNPQVFRTVYRKVFDMISLNGGSDIPTGALVSFPHDIDQLTTPTRIYGTATTTTSNYLPLPYASETTSNIIEIWADATNVNLQNGSTQDDLSQAYIVLEYTKS